VPAAQWLASGLGLLPLAPLGDVPAAELPAVIAQMKERLAQETRGQAADLWSAVYLFMGLRYPDTLIETLLQGVDMEESVTYQAIIRKGEAKGEAKGKAEGKAEEARRMLLLFGREQLGEAPQDVQMTLDALADVERLEELAVRLKHVSSWHELLGMNG
jgi:predicted transposase YdaD